MKRVPSSAFRHQDVSSKKTATFDASGWSGDHWREAPRTANDTFAAARRIFEIQRDQNLGSRARLYRPIRGVSRVKPESKLKATDHERFWFTFDGHVAVPRSPQEMSVADLISSHPMRDYGRNPKQTNKSVACWTHTTGDFVFCESLHERTFTVLADFDMRVQHISAQPFTIQFAAGGRFKLHTPDFVVLAPGRYPIAVDVKTPADANDEKYVELHRAVAETLATVGIVHVVVTGFPKAVNDNLKFFQKTFIEDADYASYTHPLLAAWHQRMTARDLATAATRQTGLDAGIALIGIRRMIWEHQLSTDLTSPFTAESEVFIP